MVARSSASAPSASSSARIGEPWHKPRAASSAEDPAAELDGLDLDMRRSPPHADRSRSAPCRHNRTASARRNRGGFSGNSSLQRLRDHVRTGLRSMPVPDDRADSGRRSRSTRRASAPPFTLSGKNITPNWQTTRSKLASSNGRSSASAWLEGDLARLHPLRRDVEHRRVEIGGDDLGLRHRPCQRRGHDAGAGRGFQDVPRRQSRARSREHRRA